jgi:drug/metabolite transporter (DMT)-like permease
MNIPQYSRENEGPMAASGITGSRAGAIGILLVLTTAVVSGCSTFVNSYAVAGTNSDAFVTVRNLVVVAMIAPIAMVAMRLAPTARLKGMDWARLVVIGLVGGAIPFLLFFHGLQLATAAHGAATASFVYRSLFLMGTVLGVVFLAERLHPRIVLAAGLLLAGNVLLLSLVSPLWTDGTSYVLAATVLWAVEYTISKRTLRTIPSSKVALGRMGFGGVFLAGYLLLTAQWGKAAALSGGQWEWVLISAALLAAFVTTWYAGLARVDLGVATSVLVLGFPITWVLTLGVNGAGYALPAAIGAATVVGGVALVIGRKLFEDVAALFRPSAAPRRTT